MAMRVEHELHRRRRGRNIGVGLTLGAFVVLLVALTMVKVSNGNVAALEGFNHTVRVGLTPAEGQ